MLKATEVIQSLWPRKFCTSLRGCPSMLPQLDDEIAAARDDMLVVLAERDRADGAVVAGNVMGTAPGVATDQTRTS